MTQSARRRGLVGLLVRRWPILLFAVAASAVLAALVVRSTPIEYESQATVLVTAPVSAEAPAELNQPRAIENEAHLARSERVAAPVRAALGNDSVEVRVATDPDADALVFTGRFGDPESAQRLTQTWVETFVDQRGRSLNEQLELLAGSEDPSDGFVTLIGRARLDGDDDEVARLETLRDDTEAARTRVLGRLEALADTPGVEITQLATRPEVAEPRWRNRWVLAALLGPLILGLAAARLVDGRAERPAAYERSTDPYGGLPDSGVEWNPRPNPGQPRALDTVPSWSAPEPLAQEPEPQVQVDAAPLRRVAPPRSAAPPHRDHNPPSTPRRINPPRPAKTVSEPGSRQRRV